MRQGKKRDEGMGRKTERGELEESEWLWVQEGLSRKEIVPLIWIADWGSI